ncbi:hypothetical protein Hanom_Chr05g00424671 [Helianthus anomalus]
MKVAKSYLKKSHGVRDPHTKRTIKTVIWSPTDKEKVIPVAPKFDKVVLKNIKFWAYDPKMAEAVIVTEENSFWLADTLDLISFHEEDIKILSEHQIRTNKQYEMFAKSWTSAALNVIGSRLFVDVAPMFGGNAPGGPSRFIH